MPSARTFWILSLIAALALLVGRRYEPGHGLTALIQFDVENQLRQTPTLATIPHHVRTPSGFDGQFYAQIALDPLLLDPDTAKAIDYPPFRARRILVPALAHVLGAGQPFWIIQVFPLINVVFWALLFALLLRTVPTTAAFDRTAVTAILFSTGALESIRLSVIDLPATYFAVLPCLVGATGLGAVAAFACTCLTRETGVLASAAYFVRRSPVERSFFSRALLGAAALTPFVLWMAYLNLRVESAFVPRGPVGLPLVHMADALALNLWRVLTELSPGAINSLLVIAGLLTQAVFLWTHRRLDDPLWRIGAAFTLLLLILGGPVWELPSAACRYMLPLTIAVNLQLVREPATPHRWWWFLAGNACLPFGVLRFLTYQS